MPKEDVSKLPPVPYGRTKKIVVVTEETSSVEAVAAIRAELRLLADNDRSDGGGGFQYVGFDTETRPKFSKGGPSHPVALIQIATPTIAYLFRLVPRKDAVVLTDSLRQLLCDQSIIKVGVGIHHDVKELNRCHGLDCCGDGTTYLDLAHLAPLRWPLLKRVGLRNLTAVVLGWRLSKTQQTKNWELKVLTRSMEEYAAADAWVALDLLGAIVG